MILKPQDIFVILKLVAIGNSDWSYARLAVDLYMSPSEVHAAIKRNLRANIVLHHNTQIIPNIRNLTEFLVHGIQYVFLAEIGALTRGMPTLYAAPPFLEKMVTSGEPPMVWPDPEGEIRGQAFSPLYKSAPQAARKDQHLYELLVLTDALRGGQARERKIAKNEIQKRLNNYDIVTTRPPP